MLFELVQVRDAPQPLVEWLEARPADESTPDEYLRERAEVLIRSRRKALESTSSRGRRIGARLWLRLIERGIVADDERTEIDQWAWRLTRDERAMPVPWEVDAATRGWLAGVLGRHPNADPTRALHTLSRVAEFDVEAARDKAWSAMIELVHRSGGAASVPETLRIALASGTHSGRVIDAVRLGCELLPTAQGVEHVWGAVMTSPVVRAFGRQQLRQLRGALRVAAQLWMRRATAHERRSVLAVVPVSGEELGALVVAAFARASTERDALEQLYATHTVPASVKALLDDLLRGRISRDVPAWVELAEKLGTIA